MSWMMRVVCVLSLAAAAFAAPPPLSDAALSAGIALAREGDFQGALLKLDEAVRRLEEKGVPPVELAQGYLYLAISYLELGQEMPAVERFRAAALRDPELRLDASEFSPQVIRFFDAARQEVAAMRAPAGAPASSPTPSAPQPRKSGSGKVVLAVVGAGAAAAAVLAIAGGDDAPATTTTTTVPPASGAESGWTSQLDVAGASGQVLLDGALVAVVPAGRAQRGRIAAGGRHRLEAVLASAAGKAGTWRFDIVGLGTGSLEVAAGTPVAAGASTVVFRLEGRPGERIVFSFTSR